MGSSIRMEIQKIKYGSFGRIRRERYRRKHIKLGLCVDCPLPAKAGHTYCEIHLQKGQVRGIRSRMWRRANNLCTKCSAPLHEEMDKTFTECIFCREKTNSFLAMNES